MYLAIKKEYKVNKTLEKEANSISNLLKDKSVKKIYRPTKSEICIEFVDGTRFFIDTNRSINLDFSITGANND